jgi:hypothetical protein
VENIMPKPRPNIWSTIAHVMLMAYAFVVGYFLVNFLLWWLGYSWY